MTFHSRMSVLAAVFLLCCSTAFGSLQRVQNSSVVVIYATEEGGRARDCADYNGCAGGPVAKAIASALKTPGITVAGLFDAVNADVVATTNQSQRPRIVASQPINVPLVKNPGKASALVIGNGAYANFPRLQGAPRDAEIVARGLSEAGFRTKTIVDAELRPIKAAIDEFLAQLGDEDTAVIYYAGHGFQLNGGNYLPALETSSSDQKALISSSLGVSALLQGLSESRAATKILILDTQFPSKGAGAAFAR